MIRMVCYDIGEDKVRKRLMVMLEDHDFIRLQYSVFAGRVAVGRWRSFWKKLEKFYAKHCQEGDRIHSHVIDVDEFKRMLILGESPDLPWILKEVTVLFV